MTYPPPGGTPEPHQPQQPYGQSPADPTAPYQQDPQPAPASGAPASGQPFNGQPAAPAPHDSHQPYGTQQPYGGGQQQPYGGQQQPYGGQQQPYGGQQPYGAPSPYGAAPAGDPYAQPYAQPYGTQPYGPGYPTAPGTNVMAILSLVFAFVFAPAAIVLGHVARRQIRQSGEEGAGLATAGLWLGYVFTALWLLACAVGAVALIAGASSSSTTTI